MKSSAIFLKQLKALGNRDRSVQDARYHKSKREHWGVAAPKAQQLVKEWAKQLKPDEFLSLAKELWKSDIFDAMGCAELFLDHKKSPISKEVWTFLVQCLTNDIDGWGLEDKFAHVAWKCIDANPELLDELESWTKSPDFWTRRAVMVYTLPFAKPGKDPERMLGWAEKYTREKQLSSRTTKLDWTEKDALWFIHKSIGWWLRDLGKHSPKRVIQFLNRNWPHLQTVARREATRKLDSSWLKQLKHS